MKNSYVLLSVLFVLAGAYAVWIQHYEGAIYTAIMACYCELVYQRLNGRSGLKTHP